MAKKTELTKVAVSIGTAAGKADRVAHRTARQVASADRPSKKNLPTSRSRSMDSKSNC